MATSTINGANVGGSFTAYIPRLNQTVTFYYKEISPKTIVAQASFTANTSSQGQLYIDVDQSNCPFPPNASMGRYTYEGVQGILARRTSNANIWFESVTGSQASGKVMLLSLLIWA